MPIKSSSSARWFTGIAPKLQIFLSYVSYIPILVYITSSSPIRDNLKENPSWGYTQAVASDEHKSKVVLTDAQSTLTTSRALVKACVRLQIILNRVTSRPTHILYRFSSQSNPVQIKLGSHVGRWTLLSSPKPVSLPWTPVASLFTRHMPTWRCARASHFWYGNSLLSVCLCKLDANIFALLTPWQRKQVTQPHKDF